MALISSDLEGLLVDWLSELLYLFEVKKFIFEHVAVEHLDEGCLRAVVSGTSFRGRITATEIKAVTSHMLDVRRDAGAFEATVYFDL